MTTPTSNKTADVSARIAELSKEVAALPQPARAALIESAGLDLPGLDICGLILSPTSLETDLKTILGRVRITTTVSGFPGSVLNVGENFQLTVKVRNCTGHDLDNVQVIASSTSFAAVTGTTNTANLGRLSNASAEVSTMFPCKAIAVTPTQSGPPDTLINVTLLANVDLRSTASRAVQGEVLAA
jgi:hypothetical protein